MSLSVWHVVVGGGRPRLDKISRLWSRSQDWGSDKAACPPPRLLSGFGALRGSADRGPPQAPCHGADSLRLQQVSPGQRGCGRDLELTPDQRCPIIRRLEMHPPAEVTESRFSQTDSQRGSGPDVA